MTDCRLNIIIYSLLYFVLNLFLVSPLDVEQPYINLRYLSYKTMCELTEFLLMDNGYCFINVPVFLL